MKSNICTLKGRRKVAQFLNDLTIKNQTRRVKSVLNSYNLKYRQKIVLLKVNGRPLLFEATLVGNLKLVNYLLDECGANVEQTGYWEMVKCTSLWVAASRNFFHVVATLLEHGADVNTQSSSQRSAVSIGCHSVKLVRYLVQHGADIQVPDCKGRTCLIYSVHSSRLCQLLIKLGANVNQTDNKGKDALHFAIRKGKIESVKILIKSGVDILRIGPKGNTPLELSAIECKPALVEYLLGTNCYSTESKANAYELLGSKLLMDDLGQTKFYWEKALQIRNQDPANLFPKTVPEHRDHPSVEIPLGVEFQTIEDLNKISVSLESMWTQALLIQLRVLGPKHPGTSNSFTEKIFSHINRAEFDPGMVLLECLFLFYATHLDPLPVGLYLTVSMLRAMAISLIEIDNYDIQHAHNLVCSITRYVSNVGMDFVDSLSPTDRQNKMPDVELYLIEILSQLGYVLSFPLTEEQHDRLNVTLYNLIRRSPHGPGKVGLLHLTIRLNLSQNVLSKLLKCGANIDWQDEWGNTAVHYAIHRFLTDHQPDMLKCLLDHGCHVDLTNSCGYCPLGFLRQNGILANPLSHITLQCMAAKVIKKYRIPYMDILPKEVRYFVNLH